MWPVAIRAAHLAGQADDHQLLHWWLVLDAPWAALWCLQNLNQQEDAPEWICIAEVP
jgi:hypothetical protein